MKIIFGTIGAAIGGVIGALIWGGIAYFLNIETGIVAWAIGGLVGFCAAVTGARGIAMGLICIFVTLGSLAGGKLLFIHLLIDSSIQEAGQEVLTQDIYEQIKTEAEAFALVTSESEFRQFMVNMENTEASHPDDVTEEEIDYFKENKHPVLLAYLETKPEYEEWRQSTMETEVADISYSEAFLMTLGFMDLIFAALGIGTAFKLGAGSEVFAEAE